MFKRLSPAIILIIAIAFILIISVAVFLGTKDCYAGFCATGWEILSKEWPSFWIFAILGFILAGVCAYFAVKNENNYGPTGKTIFLLILGAALLFGPWGKACTDKANGGVTAPGHEVQKVDQ